MSAEENQPSNINFLGQNNFRFSIKRLPNVNYFCQNVSIPSISLSVVQAPTPFAILPRPGDRLTYDPLTITFKVDENLVNYFEIQSWLEGLGHPESLAQTKDLSNAMRASNIGIGTRPLGHFSSFVSDATLSLLTNHKNHNKTIFFHDCFPTSLSQLDFISTNPTLEYLEASVTFMYSRYKLDT